MWPFSNKPKQSEQFRKNIKTLISNISNLEKQGMKQEEIVEKLSKAGWKPHVIELVMHKLHIPNSSVEKLQQYVDKQKLKARDLEEIKETLMEAGWNEDLTDVALGL
ncbi:hypothetical protein COV19_04645 [Candidatus Woesearchaeota archaeon CG10_big_fil_rev_8_21_14_0_10_44_13]|nr:MAG: hypothetical protein COV19_04645 [Candidatus Woesearchaeota archaeon CG10_big_fil_rev_8_21_14_0_10_44_13]